MGPVPAVLFPLCLFEYSSFQSLAKEKKNNGKMLKLLSSDAHLAGLDLN